MTKEEFGYGMERLSSRPGWSTSFDKSFGDMLAPKIIRFNSRAFYEAIDGFIGEHKKPTLSELVFATQKNSTNGQQASVSQFVEQACEWCDGYGLVVMNKEHRTAVACCTRCGNGQKQKTFSKIDLPTTRDLILNGFLPEKKSLRGRYQEVLKHRLESIYDK